MLAREVSNTRGGFPFQRLLIEAAFPSDDHVSITNLSFKTNHCSDKVKPGPDLAIGIARYDHGQTAGGAASLRLHKVAA